MESTGFCCAGCAYVHRLVHEHGLASYYRIKDAVTAPADAAVFQPRDYSWLEALVTEAEQMAGSTPAELTLDVQGISCAGCVWLIERIFQQREGARSIVVNAQTGQMRFRWAGGKFSVVEFAQKLQSFGYLLGPAGEASDKSESRDLVRRIGLCTAFAMNIMLFTLPVYFGMEQSFAYARLFGLLSLVFGTLSFLIGGVYFLGRAVRALCEGALHIDLPIALGVLGAYVGSVYGWLAGEERFVYFDFVGTFIVLMLIGRWAQVVAVERNQRMLLSHQPKPPRLRTIEASGKTGWTAPEQLLLGQLYWVESGQTVPVESQLETSDAEFSLASISGEAEPRSFRAGQRVPSGAINLCRDPIRLIAQQKWSESLLARLLQPGQRIGWRHRFLDRIVRGYLAGILLVALLGGCAWWWFTQDAARTWTVVTAVLVVSCPCAIGLAFPLIDEIATVAARRFGVFVREPDLWARLGRVRKLVFDKTGTLTLETPVLANPSTLRNLDDESRSALFALVSDNPHPICQCLLAHLLTHSSPAPMPGQINETIGYGVELGCWSLGRARWRDDGDAVDGTVFARAKKVIAVFCFREAARADARQELTALANRGFPAYILSGDQPQKVREFALELGIPESHCIGGCAPQQKAEWFVTFGGDDALMLGDGANDSFAFDQALCRGTPVIHRGVLEQKADFYYLGKGINGIRRLLAINDVRRKTQIAIFVFSACYNLIAVGLALGGLMNPLVAAIIMPINSLLTLVIVATGLRSVFVECEPK